MSFEKLFGRIVGGGRAACAAASLLLAAPTAAPACRLDGGHGQRGFAGELCLNWVAVFNGGISDPSGANLAGSRTYDLILTLSPGDDFQSMRIFANTPAGGSYFQHPFGQPGPHFGPPNSLYFHIFPAMAYDTFLDANGNLTVLGSTDGTNDLPPPGVFSTTQIAIAGGDLVNNTVGGDLRLMRLTFWPGSMPGQENPVFLGTIFSAQNPNGIPVPQIPEPASLDILTGAVCALAFRAVKFANRSGADNA